MRQIAEERPAPSREELRERIISSLQSQGLRLDAGRASGPLELSKDETRRLHAQARQAAIQRARAGLERFEEEILSYYACGSQVDPAEVEPRLTLVEPKTFDELRFRYARLHWSIPVSAGYGRRLRWLVEDASNGKLIGILGLGDPVFALGARDSWVGWPLPMRKQRLRHVMDAFVLGAVPPYSSLLCGKLIALLATTDAIRSAFEKKYLGSRALISGASQNQGLALLTTASALGRSSLYNRLSYSGRKVFESVGFTLGSGEFHFSNGVYGEMLAYARSHLAPNSKHETWGAGWRNRREVVRAVLGHIGLSRELVYHGVRREVFVAPLARNCRDFLQGRADELEPIEATPESIVAHFRERWLLPRARRDPSYRSFDPESLRLW